MKSSAIMQRSASLTRLSPGYLPFSTNIDGGLTSEQRELLMRSHPAFLAIFLSSILTRGRWVPTIRKTTSLSISSAIALSSTSFQLLNKHYLAYSEWPDTAGRFYENTLIA